MANTVTKVQIQDGPSDVVYRYFLQSDGASGELSNEVLLDPNWLTNGQGTGPFIPPGTTTGRFFNIQQVWYNFSGFDAYIGFQAAVNNNVWLLTPSVDSYFDFRPMGGVYDNTDASLIPTGKIILNTNGFSSTGMTGSIILKVRKMR